MKDITFAIPCYNSAAYMKKAIESVIIGKERVEVIIVNDGSSDNTLEIAKSYEEKYPDIVKVIDQENKGHGGAINSALAAATGRFFKVIDSDDHAGLRAYIKLMETLQYFNEIERYPDMLIVNYVYDKVGVKRKRVVRYTNALPVEEFFGWDRFGHTGVDQYILMHAAIYRTDILRKAKLQLPEHMFYVDNLFVFLPMKYVNTMYYLNIDFYRYFIGREDQSVNERVMIGRIDQQLEVTRRLIDAYEFMGPKKRQLYMRKYLRIMMEVSSVLCMVDEDPELLQKYRDIWNYVKEKDARLYKLLRWNIMGVSVNLPTKLGRKVTILGYHISNKLIGFS